MTGSSAPPRSARPSGRRARFGQLVSGLAALLVLAALVAPNRLEHLTPAGFVRIPVEALLYVGFFLLLPAAAARVGQVLAMLAGLVLGLVTVLKFLDVGFFQTLNRPFNAMLDVPLAGDSIDFLKDSSGPVAAYATAAGVVALIVAVLVLMTLSVRRLTPLIGRHRGTSLRVVAALSVAWVILAVLGTEIVPYTPVASRSATAIAVSHAVQVPADLRDAREFEAAAKVDAFANTPGDQLLTGLRGKDVVLGFVESYGRSALESPEFAPQVDAVLDEGTRRLDAAGFASRSGFLTSPTTGGGSWLAHATLLSGLWVKNESLHHKFIESDRLTLNGAFRRADWRTVTLAPGIKKDWPEARVYGYDEVFDSNHLGYQGPRFKWSTMPDQYVLSRLERTERAPSDRAPVMAEIPLTSSHMPWTPLPELVGWDAVGDGSIFKPMATAAGPQDSLYSDPVKVRERYRNSIEYTLNTLVSYLEEYGDDDLVMVFLGDHQPIPMVAGKNASHDVPITIVAKDPAVLDQIAGWGWQDGLNPGPNAPVWPMSDFRDRFLTAFGSQGAQPAAR